MSSIKKTTNRKATSYRKAAFVLSLLIAKGLDMSDLIRLELPDKLVLLMILSFLGWNYRKVLKYQIICIVVSNNPFCFAEEDGVIFNDHGNVKLINLLQQVNLHH